MSLRLMIVILITAASSFAYAEDDHASLLAKGMQRYAEGQHQEALLFLYRAYATQPGHTTLGLIVRTHDFMGHCSAAKRPTRSVFITLSEQENTERADVFKNWNLESDVWCSRICRGR